MLKFTALMNTGFHLTYFPLSEDIRNSVRNEKWNEVDEAFQALTKPGGRLFEFLKTFHDFQMIEFIISIRDAENDWEEDGIWHDDGSRVFAFSLSLTENSNALQGGRLGVKRKSEETFATIPTPDFGGIILFLTGMISPQ